MEDRLVDRSGRQRLMVCSAPVTTPFMRCRKVPRWLVALALVLGGSSAHGLLAQSRPAPPAALETIQIRPNVYVIFGAGANVAVHVGEDGVILVDSGSAAAADKLLASVKAITSQPIRMIINTSADADHVGGNEVLASAGAAMINRDVLNGDDHATVIAHENVLLRMSGSKGDESPLPDGAWPDVTYTQRVKSMYLNDDAVLVMRQLGAHTDGDSIVEFRRADVFVTGDIIDLQHFPNIDPKKGGSIKGELEALNRLLELTVATVPFQAKAGRTLLVPGHGRVSDYGELVEYRDMVTIVRDIIQAMVDKGMTLRAGEGRESHEALRAVRQHDPDHGPPTCSSRPSITASKDRRGSDDAAPARVPGTRARASPHAVEPRRGAGPWRRARGANGARDRPDRSHRLLGGDHLGRLALADDHADERRLSKHPHQPRRSADCRSLGSGEGRGCRRAVPGLRSAWPHARAHSAAHHVAGRRHAEAGNRLRDADPPASRFRASPPPGRADVARLNGRAVGRQPVSINRGSSSSPLAQGRGRKGSLKSVTTRLRPGYLRKNGVPYSANAVFTEYWDVQTHTNGDQYLVDTNVVDDPTYLQEPFVTALHFKKEPDGSKWAPTPCDARF